MNPVKISLRYQIVTIAFTALLFLAGVHAFNHMPRTEDPAITIRTGLVIALYPGATSEQVEKQLTQTLEKHIFKFPEVRKDKTFSTSRAGLVIINVELEDNVKNAEEFWSRLRHEVNEARASELPNEVRGPVVNSDFGDTVAMLIAVRGKHYGYRELRDYVVKIQDELRTIRDVGKLAIYGDQSEQIRITGSLARLSQYVADPFRVVQALQQRNIIEGAGSFEAENVKIPMRTTGFFTTEEQIRHVMVDVSKTGQPVYIGDFATVERRYQDPAFLVRYDGDPAVLLSVEMKKGRNMIELGRQIDVVFARLKSLLPPDIRVDLIANQPAVVESRISSLKHEFLLAIVSVILVTIILLPIRVAVIAAFAIPITLCITLGVMDALGIALHQVSIAALIIVLGITVDDAIVIADNYVELLDRKVPKAEAAWRSASDVAVPVFTATITIIASFLPLLILTGTAGEFITALPLTVAIALAVSFVVAVMLTPILCRFFISKGLHESEPGAAGGHIKKFNMLDILQSGYRMLIVRFMKRKVYAVLLGILGVAGGIALFVTVREQFFPFAERDQFVIDVWMRQGSRIESTDAVMRRIEKHFADKPGIVHYAGFVGQSAPRFYYNVNPQQPDAAYGQFIVNTASVKDTVRLVKELGTSLEKLAPEALVIVKELQQGSQMEAPVEVRISGENIEELKRLGHQVETILSGVGYARYIHRDFFNDSCRVDVNINTELTNRLGITHALVSRTLQGALDGGPVNVFWEGDRPVTIQLRLDRESRSSFSDVRDAYMTSQLTHAGVPLRSIAALEPEWQTSRLVRRNGVRTLTIRSFIKPGWYADDLLKAVQPEISAIRLPEGCRIEYGGEKANRDETFPQMKTALGISLLAIFLILLLQFGTLSEPLVIMSSIPLALPGAAIGLAITHNPFGFTACMGMISLSGIVVRNAIILVDYIREKIAEGQTHEQAATEAGERRLRPIFLTTMAAAVGVTPMILSGSSLWSPLASVIAVGLICSMFFTLTVVPVLYVIVCGRTEKSRVHLIALITAGVLISSGQASAEPLTLTLPQTVELARKENTALKISRDRVREYRHRRVSARSNYYPHLSNETSYIGISERQLVNIPAGSLGDIPGMGPFPAQNTSIDQGAESILLVSTTLTQPVTQLFKIYEADKIAESDHRIAQSDARKAENDIILGVHQLYYGLLIAEKQKDAAMAALKAAQENLRESEDAVKSGNVLDNAAIGSRARLLQSRQSLLAAENQISDLTSELGDLLNLPQNTKLLLTGIADPLPELQPFEQYLDEGVSLNPEIQAAKDTLTKAHHALRAAQDEYIPDISLFARHTYQDGVPFATNHIETYGVQMTWNIFDGGNRRGVVSQRRSQLSQAEENLKRTENRIAVEIGKAYRKAERTRLLMDAARESLSYQRENLRLSDNQLKAGVASDARHAESVAAVRKAELEELQAHLGYRLALAELERIAGRFIP